MTTRDACSICWRRARSRVDEADRLLKAVAAAPSAEAASEPGAKPRPRWLRINIQKQSEDRHGEKKNVNVRVPISFVKGGMRLGALIAPFAGEKAIAPPARARLRPRPFAARRRGDRDLAEGRRRPERAHRQRQGAGAHHLRVSEPFARGAAGWLRLAAPSPEPRAPTRAVGPAGAATPSCIHKPVQVERVPFSDRSHGGILT